MTENNQKPSKNLFVGYASGTLIEERYMLSPLNQVAQNEDRIGVSRLFILASFKPEKIFTFIFKTDVIEIELAQGKTQLWEALHLEHPKIKNRKNIQQTIEPFSASEIQRKFGTIRLEEAPEPFSSFNDLGVFHSLKIGDKPSPEPVEGRGGYGFDKLSLRLVLKQMKHTLMISWLLLRKL